MSISGSNSPLVSIVVPVYNVEAYLRQCLDSILNQSYGDFELIMVNDGSTDSSGHICDEYAQRDSRCRVIHRLNGGVSSARNSGIDLAIGKYLFFIDSDDWVEQDYLQNFMDIGDCPYVACGYKEDSATNWTLRYAKRTISMCDYLTDAEVLNGNVPSVHSCGVRYVTSILNTNSIRFRQDIHCSEDNLFNMDYFRFVDTIQVLDYVGYRYRIRPNSAVNSFHPDRAYYEKCVCQSLEMLTGDTQVFRQALYIHWIISLNHYYTFLKSQKWGSIAKKQLKAAMKDSYFRRSLAFCRTHGSLDMKIFATCVQFSQFDLYVNIVKLLTTCSKWLKKYPH